MRLYEIRHFTSTSPWLTHCGMDALVSASSQNVSCTNGWETPVSDSNREQLIKAAQLLRPLLDELVFLGGSVTGLLITDTAAGDPRATRDVDAIAAITSYSAYVIFGERLRALGFGEDTGDGAPLCRWVNGTTVLDVMPLDEGILGFSNRWYQGAMAAAVRHQLADDLVVRLVTAPYFIATKLEAFKGRGDGDFFSHDLEDLINFVDGRETRLRQKFVQRTQHCASTCEPKSEGSLAAPEFLDALPGHLRPDPASQARIRVVLERLRELTRM